MPFGWQVPSVVAGDAGGTSEGEGDNVDRQRLQFSTTTLLGGRKSDFIRAHCGERPCVHMSEGLQGSSSFCNNEHSRRVQVREPVEILTRPCNSEQSRRVLVQGLGDDFLRILELR